LLAYAGVRSDLSWVSYNGLDRKTPWVLARAGAQITAIDNTGSYNAD